MPHELTTWESVGLVLGVLVWMAATYFFAVFCIEKSVE